MQITKNHIKALIDEKGNARKCPQCDGDKEFWDHHKQMSNPCDICQGTGKATKTIPKEWVECKHQWTSDECEICNAEKIPKYNVDEIIYYCEQCKGIVPICTHKKEWVHKLKIISETEDEQTLVIG